MDRSSSNTYDLFLSRRVGDQRTAQEKKPLQQEYLFQRVDRVSARSRLFKVES